MAGIFHSVVLLHLLLSLARNFEVQSCWTFSVPKDGIHERRRISGHVIKAIPFNGSAITCIQACAMDCKCVSINLREDRGACELNAADDEGLLVNDVLCTFLNISFQNEEKDKSKPCEALCCDPNPCKHGVCTELCHHPSRRFNCTCSNGFTGRFCESDINECLSIPCLHEGTCIDQVNGFRCQCLEGYTGQQCQTKTNACFSNPCLNNATCIDEINSYRCQCLSGYTGQHCETNINYCTTNLCKNGLCVEGLNNYSCKCSPGYKGQFCEVEVDECTDKPCMNGHCTDVVNNYTCICYSGYTGRNCTIEINECESHPCKNGATCQDLLDGYNCQCRELWLGKHCEIYTTMCSVLKNLGYASQNYKIDPDGEGNVSPFTAFCDMSDKNGIGVTVIRHDSSARTRVDGCEDPGCYTKNIHYNGVSKTQLAALTSASAHCEQYIKYECYDSQLLLQGYGWWVSRDGVRMNYWGGAEKNSGKCACGMTKSCVDSSKNCNCDANKMSWQKDDGFLTDKATLPVSQLRFGDVRFYEEGFHTLGEFKCYGFG